MARDLLVKDVTHTCANLSFSVARWLLDGFRAIAALWLRSSSRAIFNAPDSDRDGLRAAWAPASLVRNAWPTRANTRSFPFRPRPALALQKRRLDAASRARGRRSNTCFRRMRLLRRATTTPQTPAICRSSFTHRRRASRSGSAALATTRAPARRRVAYVATPAPGRVRTRTAYWRHPREASTSGRRRSALADDARVDPGLWPSSARHADANEPRRLPGRVTSRGERAWSFVRSSRRRSAAACSTTRSR